MAKLKFINEVPPTGFWYIQPKTNLRIEADGLKELISLVLDHRLYRGLTPTDRETVALEVERQICSRLSEYHCKKEGPDDKWVPFTYSNTIVKISAVLGFSKAAFEWFTSGHELVPEEKALARKAKCDGCPLNWPLSGCKCGKVAKFIAKVVPKEKRYESLGVCMVCECSLPAKVWLPRNVIDASNEGRKLRFPQDGSCWQHSVADDPEG